MTHKQTLYSLRTDGDQFRITKIVDGEVESSYLCTTRECECPAGHRPSCRHRQMIPDMLARGITDTHWFWNFDTHRVVDFNGELKSNLDALNELAVREPDEIRGPNDIYCSHDLAIDIMAKDITPVGEAQHTEAATEDAYGIGPMMHDLPGLRADNEVQRKKLAAAEQQKPSWRRL